MRKKIIIQVMRVYTLKTAINQQDIKIKEELEMDFMQINHLLMMKKKNFK